MLRIHARKETEIEAQSNKAIRRDTTNPRQKERVSRIASPRILEIPYNLPASLNREKLCNLKAHQIDVERRRSTALFYFRRNAIR